MNLDKAKKRIAKQVSKGFRGYPLVSIAYFGTTPELATDVVVQFIVDEGAAAQVQKFTAKNDVRHDENIQTVIIKIIERTEAQTVYASADVRPLAET